MPTVGPVDECVAAYQRTMADLVTGPGIDLIHLGMGPDGHTASLFPGAPTLDADPGVLVLATEDPNGRQPAPAPDPDAAGDQLGPPRRLHGGRRVQGAMRWPALVRGDDLPAARVHAGHTVVAGRRRRPAPTPPRLAPMLSDADLLQLPARRPDRAGPCRARRRARAPGHLLAQGLHPPDHAVPRPLRLLHLRQGAGPRSTSPYLSPEEVLAIARGRAARRLPRGPVHPGRAARAALPGGRATGWPTHGLRLDGRLPRRHVPARRRGDRPAPPRQRRRARTPTSWPALRAVSASQGMMLESLGPDLAAHRGAPDKDPGAAAGHPGGRRRARHPLHHRHPGRHRRRPGRTSWPPCAAIADVARAATATCRRSSSRTSCPSPGTAMHRAPPCPPEDLQWTIAVARLVLPPEIHVQAPPNLSDDLAPAARRRASTTGAASRRSPPTT